MLLIISEASLRSEYVQAECHTFFDLKRPIIPLRVDNCDVPLFLRKFHHIDFRNLANFQKNMGSLLNVLPDFSGATIKSRVKSRETGFLSLSTDEALDIRPLDTQDIEQLLEEAQRIIDEQCPTFRANSLQVILPTEDVILQYPLRGDLLIGRAHKTLPKDPEINLQSCSKSGMISRRHAIIFIEGGQVYIEDCNSTNGTYINNTRIESSQAHGLPNYAVIHVSRELPIVIRYSL
jgi:hypothetical protein